MSVKCYERNKHVYNVQPGIIIDYATGDSEVDLNYHATIDLSENATESSDDIIVERSLAEVLDCDYVLNKNTKKFHYPNCQSIQDMKGKNKEYYNGDRETLIEQGYSPCGSCKP